MSYRDQMQDTDAYDGWGDDDGDTRDYSREGQRVSIVTRRFPAGVGAAINYQIEGTSCYCLTVDDPGPATEPSPIGWRINTYALRSELIF